VVTDHLIEQLAPIAKLAVIAGATDRLRISTLVLNNEFRHPAVLAQELASLDVLSDGRLEIGIGAAGTSLSSATSAYRSSPLVRASSG
jgi:alkanesulfonate monooxygenase SsuD/methylene tetrahydromethanopterin reductase-like flavin-dependent oxidoreductase (luciferase family)